MASTIASRIQEQGQTRGSAPAYYVRNANGWQSTSWGEYAGQVRRAGKAMMALGMGEGAAACMLGFNSPEWTVFDVAALSIGGVPAGIYTTCSAEEVAYIVGHCEATTILIEDEGQWAKLVEKRAELPALKQVVTMPGCPAIDDDLVISWADFLASGDDIADADFDARVEGLRGDQLATLIYTSGTTGPPKGVMLTHDNLAWTAELGITLAKAEASDCALSYLPLSHIAEQMFTIHVSATAGYPVYYARSIDKVPDDLKEVQPTIFFGVPRIWEKFYAGIKAKGADAPPLRKKIGGWARDVGSRVSALRMKGQEPSGMLAFQYNLAKKLVFDSKVKPAIGLSRAKVCVSGAAPITREVLEFMASLDIVVQEIYGQSEGSGPTTFNQPGKVKFGTVGQALEGIEVKLGDDEEILVKGRNIFAGYYKDPDATAATLSEDGWLHSGDLGAFDADGFLKIIGRKKEIIITAGGKNITPKNVEEALKTIPLINEAVMIGDRRKFCSAVVTLDPEVTAVWAKDNGVDPAKAHEDPKVIAEIQAGVDAANQQFARVEQIKKFRILPRNLTVEDKELTPTLKVKRRFVYENWAELIDSMYEEA